ncbi:hypothetical protein [Fulvivirga sediminis]|uniref:Uncharacterized protein n=1 Tax=Fulvivirga sediminis TaxID=2803949 RepID=A0A937K037_9BACT|nr:hypothetical protein [Fulvivirga sediminis]MBL3655901.1 hypothetical protein [Fulvivirga sediminis]
MSIFSEIISKFQELMVFKERFIHVVDGRLKAANVLAKLSWVKWQKLLESLLAFRIALARVAKQ